jgi:hypothetical protein
VIRDVKFPAITANSSPPNPARKAPSAACCSVPINDAQKLVTGRMAEDIVDFLEAIEIDAYDRERPIDFGRLCEGLFEPLIERRAVDQHVI